MPLHGIVLSMSGNMGEEPGHVQFRLLAGELCGLGVVDYLTAPIPTMLPPIRDDPKLGIEC